MVKIEIQKNGETKYLINGKPAIIADDIPDVSSLKLYK